jgi:uncharacterized protein
MKSIQRQSTHLLQQRATQYPVVTIMGPRQSGKTTLCRTAFADKPYVNLESPEARAFARADPKAFLQTYKSGVILDEIQNVPELLSWIQVLVDEAQHSALLAGKEAVNGIFILTGSNQLQLSAQITQSLAGRTAVMELLPLSMLEVIDSQAFPSFSAEEWMLLGGYPRIYSQSLPPSTMLSDYYATYIERDVRQLINLRHLHEFGIFIRLLAGRTGQLLNQNSLGNDVGVSSNTITQWMNVIESSYIAFTLQPWHANINTRLVKSPKVFFYDVGLACWLLGIHTPEQLRHHPLRGALFENLVVLEMLKSLRNQGSAEQLYFFRNHNGVEADVLLARSDGIHLFEIKATQTINESLFKGLRMVSQYVGDQVASKHLIYGGDQTQTRSLGQVTPFERSGALV